MQAFQERVYQKKIPLGRYILAGDIGGTKANFGIFVKQKKLELLLSLHYKSKEIKNFAETVQEVVNYLQQRYGIKPAFSCFAGAGVVSKDGRYNALTNLPWDIDVQKIRQKTGLRSCLVINDFQAIASGVDFLPRKSVLLVKKGKAVPKGARVFIGAGTGLGKGILFFDQATKQYVAYPSEGGHGELPVANECEFLLSKFIRKKTKHVVVEWEDVLSGRGLQNIYQFLYREEPDKQGKYAEEIKKSGFDPPAYH